MTRNLKYLLIAIILLITGCNNGPTTIDGGEENISFVEQPRDVSILAGDGSSLRLTLYPNSDASEGIILISGNEETWLEQIPFLQEEYEVVFLNETLTQYVLDAENYLLQRRELSNAFIVSHNTEVPEKHVRVESISAESVLEKIKGFINNN